MAKTISKKARNRIIILEFMIPALIILTIFVFYPILKSIVMSFQNWHLTSSSKEHEFVGLKNYKDVFEISHFWQMLGTTLLYTFFSVAGKMLVGLGVALLFNKSLNDEFDYIYNNAKIKRLIDIIFLLSINLYYIKYYIKLV